MTHWWDGDAVLGEPVAAFTSLEKANTYCLEYVRLIVPIGETIEDRSTDDLAHWEWDGGHKLGSAFVTRLKVRHFAP